jgi:hypothetical protein
MMRDAIVLSTFTWDTFNVPERIAMALALRGARVLYCEMPVSRFRSKGRPIHEIAKGVYGFGPVYGGAKLSQFPLTKNLQWKMVGKQILQESYALRLDDPLFIYSHIEHIAPLCKEMRANGLPIIHICMDYPEPYQYELIELSDRTMVIPKGVFHKLRARFGEKVLSIPQSIHLPAAELAENDPWSEPLALAKVFRPRLGYLGPLYGRINLPLLENVLGKNPDWQFICFGGAHILKVENAHDMGWLRPSQLPAYVASFDVGIMPYDCFDEKNLHCAPLKLFDYFLAGIPVVSTPVIPLWEYSDLIYFGDTATEITHAIHDALEEPSTSPKRNQRFNVARAHSTVMLGRTLEELLGLR